MTNNKAAVDTNGSLTMFTSTLFPLANLNLRGLSRRAYRCLVAIIAGADKYTERVTGDRLAFDCAIGIANWTRQMAINTADVRLAVDRMSRITHLTLVATSAQGIGGDSSAGFLSMDLVTVNAGYTHFTVTARIPLDQGARVAGAAQIFRGGNHHAFLRVCFPVGTVAGFTGHAGQHKLPGNGIVASGMAGKAFARLFYLL